MNPYYELLEQILRLDIESGLATAEQRKAQKQLVELTKRTKSCEERIVKYRTDMRLKEADMLRKYKRIDELEEAKGDKAARLFAAKNDDEHRLLKREVDNIEREIRDITRHITDATDIIERAKDGLSFEERELAKAIAASIDEKHKAQDSEGVSVGRLKEIDTVRETYLTRLDDRLEQHYRRVAKITRNPDGPLARVTNNSCGNCHMGVSPQLMNSIRSGKEVEFCPNCHHILLPLMS